MEKRKRDLAPRLKAMKHDIMLIEKAREPIERAIAEANERLRHIERARVRNAQISQRKLSFCRGLHSGAVRFREWLDGNKKLFQKEVFGPLVMVRS